MFWSSENFSGWLLQDVWQFNHDWYARYLCEDEFCEVYYPYADDKEWIRFPGDWDGDLEDEIFDDFDYDYYHGNLNLEVGNVETEFYCPTDCDAYMVEDQSGHTPENDDDDDFGIDDDDLIDENEDSYWWLDWEDDDYWWLDWEPPECEIGSDPDFDVESWLVEYLGGGSSSGGGDDAPAGNDENDTDETDGNEVNDDNDSQSQIESDNNGNNQSDDDSSNKPQSGIDNNVGGGYTVDAGVGVNHNDGGHYNRTDDDDDNYIGTEFDNIFVDNSQSEDENDTSDQLSVRVGSDLLLASNSQRWSPIIVASGVGVILTGIGAGLFMITKKSKSNSGD